MTQKGERQKIEIGEEFARLFQMRINVGLNKGGYGGTR